MASQRGTESLLVPAVQTASIVLIVSLVLGFCWYALVHGRNTTAIASDVGELLLDEVLSNQPSLLITEPDQPPLLGHSDGDAASEK
jgi:hypothetical protein